MKPCQSLHRAQPGSGQYQAAASHCFDLECLRFACAWMSEVTVGPGSCCGDLSRQAGPRQTCLQFPRNLWGGKGICSNKVSNTTGCVSRRRPQAEWRRSQAIRRSRLKRQLQPTLSLLRPALCGLTRLFQALLYSQLAKQWDKPEGVAEVPFWGRVYYAQSPSALLWAWCTGRGRLTPPL